MLSSPDAHEDAASSTELIKQVPAPYKALLESEAFRFTKAYSFHGANLGVWLQISPDPPLRLFSLSKLQGGGPVVCQFITAFSDDVTLTTTTTRSAFVFPLPYGTFQQSFPSHSPESLWRAHLRGEGHILSTLGVSVTECRLPFLDAFKQDVIRRMEHVVSRPFWVVRGVYWYSIKRFLLHNKPIWQQNIRVTYGTGS